MEARTRRFRQLLESDRIIRSLGVHDVFCGMLAERLGLETVFMGGFGTSASILGLPDLNFLTQTEMAQAVQRMTARLSIPVIVDGDTGHGDLHHVFRTVELFESAGAAGILIEDQVFPKRCGHFTGKTVVELEEMERRLQAALTARRDPGFVIVARTDSRESHGLDEAIRRVQRFAELGADCVFIEAPLSEEELRRIPREVSHPLLVNMLTGGKTPQLPAEQLEALGYRIAVWPIASLLAAGRAFIEVAQTLLSDGHLESIKERMLSFEEVKEHLDLDRFLDLGGRR